MSAAAPLKPSGRSFRTTSLRFASVLVLSLACAAAPMSYSAAVAPAAGGAQTLAPASPAEARSGALMLRNGQGYVEAVRLATDVQLAVSGPTVRARVTQAFRNTTDRWVEAVYVYPLPEDGAVDTLRMVVGNRVIVGEIKEKQAAVAEYEAARDDGLTASLVEQERPNLFTNRVANVGPGETVVVQIEYQAPVRLSGGVYSVRVPLNPGIPYNPPPRDGRDPVPDRERLTPPVRNPAVVGKAGTVTLGVRLQPGFPTAAVDSPYHPITVRPDGGGSVVALAQGSVPADRDFELSWRAAGGQHPAAAVFRETVAGQDYVLAYVTPPSARRPAAPAPREVVFVIDNSGSMSGASMPQAKASLDYALSRLTPGDRFNVVRFDDTYTQLFPDTVAADPAMVGRARAFVAGLEAEGGTEMVPALKAALVDPRPNDRRYLRQVVFLTDGEIGNEQELLDQLAARRGRSRVFMVGIGSAPNSYLMSRASELGRGVFTHIGSPEEVETDMRELFEKLERPVAVELSATFDGVRAEGVTPAMLPDVYAGEPVVLAARVSGRGGMLRLRGLVDGRPWSVELPLDRAVAGQGISKLWARRQITDAEVARTLGQIDGPTGDQRILALALEHHLVTALTSLVAVDRTPKRPAGTPLTREEIPIDLPAGWDFDHIFGPPAADASLTQADLEQLADPVDLGQGATDAELRLLLGLLFLLAALALLSVRPGRREVRA